MNSQVRFEVEVEAELLAANLALVRLLSRVDEHVALEFGVVQESLVAKLKRALKLNRL